MLRIAAGITAGFFAWMILWFGGEQIIAAVWPRFGAHQAAFQSAIENGGPFIADSTILLVHILLASIVSVIAGFLTTRTAGENKRPPLILGCLLLAMGLLKAGMTWELVPLWYHVIFAAIVLPMTIIGGQVKAVAE